MRAEATALALIACCSGLAGCNRDRSAPSQVQAGIDAEAADRLPASGRWLLRRLEVETAAPPREAAAGPSAVLRGELRAALLEALATSPQVAGLALDPTATRPADVAVEDQAALYIRASWQRMSASGQAVAMDVAAEGSVALDVLAHAEAPGPDDGANAIAERRVTVSMPIAADVRAVGPWLLPRLQRAATSAASEALGQLWAQRALDTQLSAGLDSADLWQLIASTRECGERGLIGQVARIEALAADSRKDVAVVAIAALGRLGRSRSVGVLQAQAMRPQPEVIDAALVALSTLEGAEAGAALRQLADEHPLEAVRRRATSLLQRRSAVRAPL